jgi:hypothetical protein
MAFDILLYSLTHSLSVLRSCLVASAAPAPTTTTSADFSLRHKPSPFQALGEISPGKVRTPSSHIRRIHATSPWSQELRGSLPTRSAWRRLLCGSCSSARLFTLHASFPRSVTLTQLRLILLTVTSSQRGLHPLVCAHAGRTKQKTARRRFGWLNNWELTPFNEH